MSQNSQINTPTENNQTFYSNDSQQVIQLNQSSSNILYNDNTTATSGNSLPALYGTTLMTYVDSTSQNYPTMPYSYNVGTQNPPQPAMNISSSLPSTPEIIRFEIPG